VIADGSRVSIEYTLTLADGAEVATNVGEEPLIYSHGAGEILPKLEEELLGLAVGDSKEVKLTADEGYGPVNDEAFRDVPTDQIPEEARNVGALLVTETPEGDELTVRVHEIDGNTTTLDFNHPLAGQALVFAVVVSAVE
jgi:FKBP-type peptidyl-prolyl cis-trans isomerase SlyD